MTDMHGRVATTAATSHVCYTLRSGPPAYHLNQVSSFTVTTVVHEAGKPSSEFEVTGLGCTVQGLGCI